MFVIKVDLTPSQIFQGANAGVLRQVQNIKKNRTPRYGSGSQNDWQLHIEGCLGELALASYLGLFWDANLGMLSRGDVGDLEVRTRSKHYYDLIIHDGDKDTSKYVLVTGVNGSYQIHGWLWGFEGKRKEYWSDPAGDRAAYFIKKSNLRSLDTIHSQISQQVVAA